MARPELGDFRYFVEYIDYAQGVAIMRAAGADPENDSIFDYCDQYDITARSIHFPSKWRAVQWAKRNKKLDAFNMPRIVEQTYQRRAGDDIHTPSPPAWEQTGYWEMNGNTEIEGDQP
jgi:hypothetical protein